MKNFIIGIILLVSAFYLLWEQGQQQVDQQTTDNSYSEDVLGSFDTNISKVPNISPNAVVPTVEGNKTKVNLLPEIDFPEVVTKGLTNSFSSLIFTNRFGSIKQVMLKKHSRLSQDYNMSHFEDPMLSLSFEDENGNKLYGFPTPEKYEIVTSGDDSVVYKWEKPGELRIERYYSREDNQSYVFDHKTILTNLSENPLELNRIKLNLGSAFRMNRLYNPFDNAATYLNVGYFNDGLPLAEGCSCAECSGRIDGEKEEFFQLNEMGVNGNLETRKLSQAKWACVNNQFFINIVRPIESLGNVWVNGQTIQPVDSKDVESQGITGSISVPLGILRPNQSKELNFQIYAGPKDYSGLAELGHEQKKVMQFGVFWWISEPLSWVLNKLYNLLGSYGLAIIILTVLVKLILWPLTAQATRSQKKMQSLQGPMSKLREKYKGNSQKLNQEMMKFYKEHKVNPFAGCWPILIQIPIFLGMFWMLRSAAELYGQSFLWAKDLSEQDHVGQIQGFSLNILPILMVVTQWLQMKLNPMQMGPELSDAQRINAKMMRFMPFMFLIFLYFFSSALVLYWTVQNLMTIFQTLITKNKTDGNETTSKLLSDSDENVDSNSKKVDISEKEKRYRNLLGLKGRGKIDVTVLQNNFEIRSKNYSDEKLDSMSLSKRRQAMDKKERLETAYAYLMDKASK
jgi:YidC/Oxa1 family membrane protein insertase